MKNYYLYDTEIGKMVLAENGLGLTDCYLADQCPTGEAVKETQLLKEAAKQLSEYFAGKRKNFDLSLSPQGTAFQQKIWSVLQTIPYGETWSYKQVAQIAGNAKASRAVGMANNKNTIMIIIPCHRVIGSNGSLVGYAGGLAIKERLLALEHKNAL